MEEITKEILERLERIEKAVDPRPQALKLYKGATGKWGALQLELTPIHRSQRDLGALFISAANPLPGGEKKYDWKNKIVMSWNLNDIANILDFIVNQRPDKDGKAKTTLYHDPQAGSAEAHKSSKIFNLAKMDYGWFVGVSHHENGKPPIEVKLPVTDGEMLQIKGLLVHATVRILGW